ncbi:glycoside hydrolase family 3 C-terminal domain-containing protein [uncultured Sphingomonas sp.]|uniref:glycoside hydrolase family 3 C-terminal domain-containing protein n=1 Tax=uncultured Sphingomonas sp. TaxID=158754 RepID=UPI0025D2A393|nr:glycoside hydrolase family 3 C-terminal domain-containing protein [uncultured Sphingomonas sp.]
MPRHCAVARMSLHGSAIALAAVAAVPGSAQIYADPSRPVEERVADLVGRMTLEEKAAQLQNTAPGIARLGVPPYDYWNEALHGVARAGEATIFPQAIGMASTWDKDLMKREGEIVAVEGRAKYNQAQRDKNYERYFGLTFWSPNINIFRDPRWGRGQETLGEDPYLSGLLGTQFITGVQGDNPTYYAAIATPKHYAVHSGPEPLRHGFNVDVAPRDLTETYLPAFRRAITEGHAASLMCAYNAVDGKPACASPMLLQDILRRDWGFKGFVTSDCGAIDDITSGHKFTKTNVEGAALSIKAGTDTGCNFKNEYLDLPKSVKAGYLTEADIDVALKRLFTARMQLGMFDPASAVPFSAIPISANHSAEHKQVALRAARESLVLLKNDGTLPLTAKSPRVAVVGPTATSLIVLEGNYMGTSVKPVLPLDGMEQAFGKANVTFAQGAPFTEELAVPVPRTAFGQGLTVHYFNGPDFQGAPVATGTVREIDVNYDTIAPAKGVDPASYSVRWTGTITPPAPGTYSFELDTHRCDLGDGNESFTIKLEGQPDFHAASACSGPDKARRTMQVRFTDTRPRAFTLELSHKAGRSGSMTLSWKAPLPVLRDEAVKAAANADVVVAFVGLNAWLEGEEMPLKVPGFVGGDRTHIELPAAQLAMIDALAATGKPLVIVMQSGSAIALGARANKARAIVQAWYPGEQGGQAIADVLKGVYNPSGRLPVTFYTSTDQLPPFESYGMANRTYRYFSGQPEYAFGHGLSYTRFAYSDLKLGSRRFAAGQPQQVSVRIRNSGKVAGDEVAQLYLSVAGRPGVPLKSLKGFERVHLAPGQSKTVTFDLSPRDLAFSDDKGVMRITPASYHVWVGGGQPGTSAPGVTEIFAIDGELALPR